MTFEILLVKYIYQHKQVSLEGFGTIMHNGVIPEAEMIHKNRHIPLEGLSFDHNLKTATDENFISYYAEQKGKIRPLAISDIESHLQLARQLINIGNPYTLDGIGSFEKQNSDLVKLLPGYYINTGADVAPRPRIKDRIEVPQSFPKIKIPNEQYGRNAAGISNGTKRILLATFVLVLLGVGGWFVWAHFFGSSQTLPISSPNDADVVKPFTDTSAKSTTADTSAKTTEPELTAIGLGGTTWKAYFRQEVGKTIALQKLKFYIGNSSVKMETSDSITFKFYAIIQCSTADTAFKKDSIRRFFARPVTLVPTTP